MSDHPTRSDEGTDRAVPDGGAGANGDDEQAADSDGGSARDSRSGLVDRVRAARSERTEAARTARDPFAALERDVGADATAGDPATADPDSGPTADPDGDPFEAMDVDAVDETTVWEALAAGDADPAQSRPQSRAPDAVDPLAVGADGDADLIERDDPHADRRDHAVSKDSYCQRCEFFAAPPEVRCTRAGTEIVEVIDSERFRVRGCPMVERGGATAHGDGPRD